MTKLEKLIEELCPNGVEKYTLSDVTLKFTDGMHNLPKTTMEISDYRILSAQNILNGCIDLTTTKFVSEEVFEKENKRTDVKKGDVLLTIVGAIGRVAVVEDDLHALFQRSVCVIKPDNSKIISKYLQYMLESNSVQAFIKLNAHGAAQKGIYLKDVGKIPVFLPPLEVQAEIVKILDDYSTSVAALQQELEKELTARKKQYEYYRDMLLNFGVLGGGTSECEWKTIENSSNCSRGKRVVKTDLNQNGSFAVYQNCLTPMGYYNQSNRKANITYVITAGAAGEIGFCNDEFWAADDCLTIESNGNIIDKYIYYFLMSKQDYIKTRVRKASIPRLDRKVIENIKIPVPPLSEQERIVQILDRFDKLCNDLSDGLPAEIEARQKQYEYYRDKLLTFKELIK